jgi:hypothetical protein
LWYFINASSSVFDRRPMRLARNDGSDLIMEMNERIVSLAWAGISWRNEDNPLGASRSSEECKPFEESNSGSNIANRRVASQEFLTS